jgi:hypothetical protein
MKTGTSKVRLVWTSAPMIRGNHIGTIMKEAVPLSSSDGYRRRFHPSVFNSRFVGKRIFRHSRAGSRCFVQFQASASPEVLSMDGCAVQFDPSKAKDFPEMGFALIN